MLFTEQEAVKRWPFLNRRWLQGMRFHNQGPKYHKFGQNHNGRLHYRVCDIEAWIMEYYQMRQFVKTNGLED